MIAKPTRSHFLEPPSGVNRSNKTSFFIKDGFSNKRVFRKHPVLAGFHRGIDGALAGVIFCAALMSALALHSQYLWTLSFSRLEATRDLNQKLEESITNLESYFLASTSISKSMVATKAADLLYLDALDIKKHPLKESKINFNFVSNLFQYPITHGY